MMMCQVRLLYTTIYLKKSTEPFKLIKVYTAKFSLKKSKRINHVQRVKRYCVKFDTFKIMIFFRVMH